MKKINKFVLCIILLAIYVLFIFCMNDINNQNKLSKGRQNYEEFQIVKFEEQAKNIFDDIQIEAFYEHFTEKSWMVRESYYSNAIDEFYMESYDSNKYNMLFYKMKQLKSLKSQYIINCKYMVDDTDIFVYTHEADDEVIVKSKMHTYELYTSNYTGESRLYIDDIEIYEIKQDKLIKNETEQPEESSHLNNSKDNKTNGFRTNISDDYLHDSYSSSDKFSYKNDFPEVYEYGNPEDFYYDYYYDFLDYEDAEDFYNDAWMNYED